MRSKNTKNNLKNNQMSARKYYLTYTLVFFATSFLVYLPFLWHGKSFVFSDVNGGGDGLVQHYNSFLYYGDYLQSIVRNLIQNHKLEIPMFDMSIGYGQDIIQTLSYYVIGDPFSALSIFFTHKNAELGYSILILARIYTAGIAFSSYCRYRASKEGNIHPGSILVGSIIYTFSTYTIFIGTIHPYFTNPMIYLPLICIGAEKMLEGKKPLAFILAVGLAGISNFYFFYMLVLFTVLYVLFRFIELNKGARLKDFGQVFLRFLGAGTVGTSIASVLVLPSVMGIYRSSRVKLEAYVPLIYKKEHFSEILGGFFSYMSKMSSAHYVYLGYTVVGFISLAIVFLRMRKDRSLRFLAAGIIMMLVFLSIPFFGHMFNGFSYVTNRWVWAFAFLISFSLTKTWSLMETLTKKEWTGIGVLTGILIAFGAINENRSWLMMILVFIICIVGIILIGSISLRKKSLNTIVPLMIVIVSVSLNAWFVDLPIGVNYLKRYTDKGSSYSSLTSKAPGHLINKIDDESIYRYDLPHFNNYNSVRNSSMQLHNYSTACYFSTSNHNMTEFFKTNYLNYAIEQTYVNLDNRSMIEALAAAKYVVLVKNDVKYLPYGYREQVKTSDKFDVYKTDYSLPFGFTTDKYIRKDTYDALSPTERQQAFLQGIVLEDSSLQENKNLQFSDMKLEMETVKSENVELQFDESGGRFIVTEDKGFIEFNFDSVIDGELYFVFTGLDFEVEKKDDPYHTVIDLSSGDYKTWLTIRNKRNNYYSGMHNFISSLNYSENERASARISFRYKGEYTFDDFYMAFQPIEGFVERIADLSEYHLENVVIDTNTIKGEITVPNDRILCLQVPYSNGWKCFVDGIEKEIKPADIGFMGVEIEKGSHSIEFRYKTPYLQLGSAISILTVLLLIIWYNISGFKKRRNKNADL